MGGARQSEELFRSYQSFYESLEEDFMSQVEALGLPFEQRETQPRALRAHTCSTWRCRNNDASLVRGWISPACERCRTGERMLSSFISLQCPKSCYFCFNKAQEGYEYFLRHKRNIAAELVQFHDAGESLDFFAITGGEPCLFPNELLDAVATARRLFPACHIRLYTSGANMTFELVDELCARGLNEVRFSVKLEEGEQGYSRVLDLVRYAASSMDVLVEMPVVPGTLNQMKRLLSDLDEAGARGINLLEFCYPLNNADEYARRGFAIRKPPYEFLYDYWYAGSIPIAQSEAEALELLRFAEERGLGLGVHYCSFDNKNSGQIYAQNAMFAHDDALQEKFPLHVFDQGDFFIKSAKAFGVSTEEVHSVVAAAASSADPADLAAPSTPAAPATSEPSSLLGMPFEEGSLATDSGEVSYVEFPLACASAFQAAFPESVVATSYCVLEQRDSENVLREIAVRRFGCARAW